MKKLNMLYLFSLFLLASWSVVNSQNFAAHVHEIGGTFCRYLAMKSILPRRYLMRDCEKPTCAWDNWKDALSRNYTAGPSKRVVLSYAHNGFGNQLWQHTIAFMIAESLNARLYISIIPDKLCPDGYMPPNTFAGMNTMERLLPDEFEYQLLPPDAPDRILCEQENFFLSDRPRDFRDHNYSSHFRSNLFNLIVDKNPRCLKMLGYFQNYPLCASDVRQMWTPRMFANFTDHPGPNDISIYLRCMPRHYYFNEKNFYDAILSRTSFDRVWLFQAPECPTKLSNDPSRDGSVAAVVRLLVSKYNATRWPQYPGEDDVAILLNDLAGLSLSRKLILPVSSWAFWAGLFSNATEIHVNAPPHHSIMTGMNQYIYHNEKARQYFGRYNETANDIFYDWELDENGNEIKPHAR